MGNCFLYKRGFGGGFGGGGGGEDIPEIEKTASGKVISIHDSMEKPLKGLRLFGKTTQNGTPSPDAPVPLESVGDGGSIVVSVAGKNLIDFSKRLPGYELTGNIDIDRQIIANNKWYVTDWIPVEPLTQYTVSGLSSTFCLQADKNYNGIKVSQAGNTFRTQANVRFLRFNSIQEGYATPQLEKGSTATEYEPYKEPQTLTLSTPNGLPGIHVSEGGNYTDENGWQWNCDEVDFGRGKYVQRIGKISFNGTEMWEPIPTTNGKIRFLLNGNNYNIKASAGNYGLFSHGVCGYTGSGTIESIVQIVNSSPHIFLLNYQSLDTFKAFLAEQYADGTPLTVAYILATPIETALSAEQLAAYAALRTISPSTTIYNDADSYMEVKYIAKGG